MQTAILGIEAGVIVGVGFTVIVKLLLGPAQLLAVGVTVIVAVTGVEPEFEAVKFEMFPEPLALKPIELVLFVHAKVVPDTGPEKVVAPPVVLLQKD